MQTGSTSGLKTIVKVLENFVTQLLKLLKFKLGDSATK